jgi:hypothetical protein
MEPVTREELFYEAILNGKLPNIVPITRQEMYLAQIAAKLSSNGGAEDDIFPETDLNKAKGEGFEWDPIEGVLIKLNAPINDGEKYTMTVNGRSYDVVAFSDESYIFFEVDSDDVGIGSAAVTYSPKEYQEYGDYNACFASNQMEMGETEEYDWAYLIPQPYTLKITKAKS